MEANYMEMNFNFNVNEIEEAISKKLQEFSYEHRRDVSVVDEIEHLVKLEFGRKEVDSIRLVNLKTDENGNPKEVIFNMVKSGEVIEKYRNSVAELTKDGKVLLALKLNAENTSNTGKSSFSKSPVGGSASKDGFITGKRVLVSALVAILAVSTAGSYKSAVKHRAMAAEPKKYQQMAEDAQKELSGVQSELSKTQKELSKAQEDITRMEKVLKNKNLVIKGDSLMKVSK